jgi:hypothetical protein
MVDSLKLIFLELWISHILPVRAGCNSWRKSEARDDRMFCHNWSILISQIVIERFEGFP